MIIPKFIIDQSVINNEIRVLNAHLSQQRQLKQTLLLYLNKISDGLYSSKEEKDTTSLISCLKGIQATFENIKDNIAKLIELKEYLEKAIEMNEYNSEYFEKYNEDYIKLFNKLSEDNIFYYSFMESLLKYMSVTFPGEKPSESEVPNVDKIAEKLENFSTYGKHAAIEKEPEVVNKQEEIPTIETVTQDTTVVDTPSISSDTENTMVFNNESVENILDDDFVDASDYTFKENPSFENDTIVVPSFEPQKEEVKFETKKFDFYQEVPEDYTSEIPEVIENTENIVEESPEVETIEEEPSVESVQEVETISHEKLADAELHEKTLLVSEKMNNVVLPYSTQDLEDYFSANPEKYSSIQDIIDKEYTLPLERFKNQPMSRFKEAYNLARNKSGYSKIRALKIANEVMFNTNLDPTIITACKNVEELEIYLGCLEDNDLDSFKCFKIVYDYI